MTQYTMKDFQQTWNYQKTIMNIENEDEQDIYISERSSIASSDDLSRNVVSPPIKRQSTPSPPVIFFHKPMHGLRFIEEEPNDMDSYVATCPVQIEIKDEKSKKKTRRKETKPTDFVIHHQTTTHGHPPKLKVPTKKVRHRPSIDNQIVSHESFDNSQIGTQGAFMTSPIKPNQVGRTTRREGAAVSITTSNHSMPIENEHLPNKKTPRQSYLGKEIENDERRDVPNRRNQVQQQQQQQQQQRRRTKPNLDWADQHISNLSTTKFVQDPNPLMITSSNHSNNNHLNNRPNNSRQKPSSRPDHDEVNRLRVQPTHSPSIPSTQNHFQHSFHQNIRRRQQSGSQISSDLPSVDSHIKKSFDRTTHFQNSKDIFRSSPAPPSSLGTYATYLPPITRENHAKPTVSRFPNEYYGTLARQNTNKDWESPVDVPKIYKSDAQTRFYDRYLTVAPDKRLVT